MYNFLFVFAIATTDGGYGVKDMIVSLRHEIPTIEDIKRITQKAREDNEVQDPVIINWMRLADDNKCV